MKTKLLSLLVGCFVGVLALANEIFYTSSSGDVVTPNVTEDFDANIISNTYANGHGVIVFDDDITYMGEYAFSNCRGLASVTVNNNDPASITLGECVFEGCPQTHACLMCPAVARRFMPKLTNGRILLLKQNREMAFNRYRWGGGASRRRVRGA